jgi:hypothetical protein
VIGYDAPLDAAVGTVAAGNAFPIDPNTVFVNYNGGSGGDYRVATPYQGTGLDGKDLGAEIVAIHIGADKPQCFSIYPVDSLGLPGTQLLL